MPRFHSKEFPWYAKADTNRREQVIAAAKLILNAAHTAPTTGGVDHIEAEVVWGEEEIEQLAEKMEELSYLSENKRIDEMFRTEAEMVRQSDCFIVIGDFRARNTPFDVDCGFCGGPKGCGFLYSRRKTAAGQIDHSDKSLCKMMIDGPLCQMYVQNLGYSVGSALWMARNLLVDARPFMTVGLAASKLGYCQNSALVVGILLSATSKNPFVDVNYNYSVVNIRRMVDSVRKNFIISRQFGPDYRLVPQRRIRKGNTEKEEK